MKSGAYLRMIHVREFIEANKHHVISVHFKHGDGNSTLYEKNNKVGRFEVKKRTADTLWQFESCIPFSGVNFGLHYNINLFSKVIIVKLQDGTQRSYELQRFNNYAINTIDKRVQYLSKILQEQGLVSDVIVLITQKHSNQLHQDISSKYKKYFNKDILQSMLALFDFGLNPHLPTCPPLPRND